MNKRGQFFIVAAMIVVSVVAGLSQVVNYAQVSEGEEKIYTLSKEIDFETKRVLDWGVFNDNEEELDELITRFLTEYDEYIGEENTLFIVGNEEELQALHFTFEGIGSVGLNTNERGQATRIEINRRTQREADVTIDEGRRTGESRIIVKIDDSEYYYNLKNEQENFYLLIVKEKGDETYVVSR